MMVMNAPNMVHGSCSMPAAIMNRAIDGFIRLTVTEIARCSVSFQIELYRTSLFHHCLDTPLGVHLCNRPK